jgi:hypothetical protein
LLFARTGHVTIQPQAIRNNLRPSIGSLPWARIVNKTSRRPIITASVKRRILEEVAQGGTSVAELVRRYGIDRHVPRR